MSPLDLANNSDDSGSQSGDESGVGSGVGLESSANSRSRPSPSNLPISRRSRPTTRAVTNDFMSFPTILDPQQEHRSFSTIFSDTLRSVTASALSSPIKRNPPHDAKLSVVEDSSLSPLHRKRPVFPPALLSPPSTILSKTDKSVAERIANAAAEEPDTPQLPHARDQITHFQLAHGTTHELTHDATHTLDHEPNHEPNPEPSNVPSNRPTLLLVNGIPLRLATAPPSVATVHASRPVLETFVDATPATHDEITLRNGQMLKLSTGALEKSLHSKLTAAFNNLPNDIIVSDDLASDLEIQDSLLHTSPQKRSQSDTDPLENALAASLPLSEAAPLLQQPHQHLQFIRESSPMNRSAVDFSLYSGPIALPSAVRVSGHTPASTFEHSQMSSLSSLKQQNQSAHKKLGFSAGLLGNAKHLLHSNLYDAVSSTEKRRRKKPVKASHNPLKNGGIPKKYWMNDSFVSDCLNCFKPFTAFRRKHHCRFCGQIFCSDCTVFISYDQHRHEKRAQESSAKPHRHRYKDKLRVCKPCYSDVIVYLSDDSLDSDSEDCTATRASGTHGPSLSIGTAPLDLLTSTSHSFDRARTLLIGSQHQLLSAPILDSNELPDQVDLLPATPSQGPPSTIAQMFLNEAKSPHSKPVPQMAIPATRAGLAVEIPVLRTPLATNQLPVVLLTPKKFPGSLLTSVSSANVPLLLPNLVRHWNSRQMKLPSVGLPKPLSTIGSWATTAWTKQRRNQQFFDPGFAAGEKLGFRQLSSSSLRSPADPESLAFIADDASSDLDTNGNGQTPSGGAGTVVRSFRSDSDSEDEQVMSLYSSLHLGSQRAGLRKLDGKSQNMQIVPTLGEFPTITYNDHGVPFNYNVSWGLGADAALNTSSSFNYITGLPRPDIPNDIAVHAELLRARARANASLERIRSRRRTRPSRVSSSKRNSSGSKARLHPVGSPLFMSAILPHDSFQLPARTPISPSLASLTRSIPEDTDATNSSTGLVISINLEDIDGINASAHTLLPMESDSTPMETMSKAYTSLFDDLITQTLTDCDILTLHDRWVAALKLLLAYIQKIAITDTLDIRQYVKIKCIPGGRIEDISSFAGMFMTQNIDSRRMELQIENPKIVLLTFPIEYLKQRDQFISLRIIHSQQLVYLTNLVSRIVSLEPDVVVVGDSVCGIARSLLEAAGVTVLSNTKPQNIERISRYTNADIFQSVNDLFFKKGTLGTCKRFCVQKRVHNGIVKTFTYFDGTIEDRGFSIALRGAGPDVLLSVKYAAETVLPGFLSSRFEVAFFRDVCMKFENVSPSPYNASVEELFGELDASESVVCGTTLSDTEVVGYLDFFRKRHLSLSPSVRFPYPRKLAKVVTSYVDYLRFWREFEVVKNAFSLTDISPLFLKSIGLDFDGCRLPTRENIDICNAVRYAAEFHLKGLLCEYQFRSRIWSQAIGLPCYQLYPSFHRSIHMLHSTVSIKYATPCAGPNHLVVDYYTENDKALGSFLDEIFDNASTVCEECNEKMIDHYKTYVNGNAKIDVVVERIGLIAADKNLEGRNQRVVWSSCRECSFATPVLPMSDDACHLSFGKFMELCFYGGGVSPIESTCPHDYFKFHNKFFGLGDMVIRMEDSHVHNYHVELPKKQMDLHPAVDIRLKLEAFNNVEAKAEKLFASVLKRLNRVKIDSVDKADEGLDRIKEMKHKLELQSGQFKVKTQEVYESTEPVNHLCLNGVLRELQELAVAWDYEFNEFEAHFLPSENDITRLTQFHLRNFLMEKTQDSDTLKEKTLVAEHPGQLETGISVTGLAESGPDASSLRNEAATNVPEQVSLYNPSPQPPPQPPALSQGTTQTSFIMDRISRIEAFLESERSAGVMDKARLALATTSDGSGMGLSSVIGRDKDPENQSKVVRLANLYNKMNIDNISLEFKKQRQEELQRKSHTYRAFPIVESKPVVEIYNNIEDVVNGNDELLAVKRGGNTLPKEDAMPENASDATEVAADATGLNEVTASIAQSMDIPQPEKTSLLKSLTNFWADRSATLWDSLEYPLESHEHTFADSNVIVREDEPSSLVAFCLSSNDYKQKIKSTSTEAGVSGGLEFDVQDTEPNIQKIENFAKIQKKFKNRSNYEELTSVEKTMNKVTSNHLKYQFSDNNTTFSCKIFYSEQFEAFREACGTNDSFIQSLSRCVKWNSSGGKSGLHFLKTLDDRYILKELSKSELDLFVSIAPFYFRYGAQSVFNSLTSAIAKIYGFYQIHIKNNLTGKLYKMDFLSMENLFCNHAPTRIFDLKGSMRNRHVQQTGKENEVLLDENMIEYIYELPVFVNEQLKKLLRGSLFNDTSFLLAMDVMDYSLVVGIDDSSHKLYIGIIDWLRAFTWDKRVENWVKGNNLMTRRGAKKGKDPTIVTPKQYKTRFREAMERYLLEVPDIWYEGGDR